MIANKEQKVNNSLSFYMVLFLISQKLAIHVGGYEFSLALFLFPLMILQLGVQRKVTVNKKRLLLFLAVLLVSFFSCLINYSSFKYFSYLLFLVLYFLVCFTFKLSDQNREAIYNAFRVTLLVGAIISIFQFMGQLVGLKYMDLFDYVPKSIKLTGFNTYYSLSYGSRLIKSNGWIFLEPSFCSQFMALGMILILSKGVINRNAIIHLVIYGVGLICSFSGTGILLLAVAFFPALGKLSRHNKMLVTLGILVALILFSRSQYFYAVADRVFEIRASESSGAIRFINPFLVAFGEYQKSFLFGSGAGIADDLKFAFQVNHNAITKVMVEYGFFTLVLFILFIVIFFLRNRISVLSVSVLLMYFFLSGNLLQPSILYILYFAVEAESPKSKQNPYP